MSPCGSRVRTTSSGEGNMTRRWRLLVAAFAAAIAVSGSAALAHQPEEFGTPLTGRWGESFWFIDNFQTAPNPFNPANTHLTSSDIAFWDDLAFVATTAASGSSTISKPEPKLVSDVRCYGPHIPVTPTARQAGQRPRHRRAARRFPRLPRPELLPREGHRRGRLRRAGPGLGHRPEDRPARHGRSAVGLRPAERRLLALGDVQLGREGRQLHRRVVR
jgi:hypothetical protein